jgi:hypothetical protein
VLPFCLAGFESSFLTLPLSYAREGVFLSPSAVEHLAQEIIALEVESSRLAQRLEAACERYLAALRKTLPRQLVQACYVLCTQVHPLVFLRLNFDQRYQLQQHLKQVGEEIAATMTLEKLMQQAQQQAAAKAQELLAEEAQIPSAIPEQSEISPASEPETIQNSALEYSEPVPHLDPSSGVDSSNGEVAAEPKPQWLTVPTDPEAIAQWLEGLSEVIRAQLRRASNAANAALQQADIFESTIPLEILEAKRSREPGQGPSGPPNLLRLVVSQQASEDEGEVQILAVDLRLPEIEFTDPHLMDQRRELQTLMQELRRLSERYTERQRQWAIAQAETAWRSSWPRD